MAAYEVVSRPSSHYCFLRDCIPQIDEIQTLQEMRFYSFSIHEDSHRAITAFVGRLTLGRQSAVARPQSLNGLRGSLISAMNKT